jgi:hypothetical protein
MLVLPRQIPKAFKAFVPPPPGYGLLSLDPEPDHVVQKVGADGEIRRVIGANPVLLEIVLKIFPTIPNTGRSLSCAKTTPVSFWTKSFSPFICAGFMRFREWRRKRLSGFNSRRLHHFLLAFSSI